MRLSRLTSKPRRRIPSNGSSFDGISEEIRANECLDAGVCVRERESEEKKEIERFR